MTADSNRLRGAAVSTREAMVCDACAMVLPTDVHATAHLIVHGTGHEARWVTLDYQNRLVP